MIEKKSLTGKFFNTKIEIRNMHFLQKGKNIFVELMVYKRKILPKKTSNCEI